MVTKLSCLYIIDGDVLYSQVDLWVATQETRRTRFPFPICQTTPSPSRPWCPPGTAWPPPTIMVHNPNFTGQLLNTNCWSGPKIDLDKSRQCLFDKFQWTEENAWEDLAVLLLLVIHSIRFSNLYYLNSYGLFTKIINWFVVPARF